MHGPASCVGTLGETEQLRPVLYGHVGGARDARRSWLLRARSAEELLRLGQQQADVASPRRSATVLSGLPCCTWGTSAAATVHLEQHACALRSRATRRSCFRLCPGSTAVRAGLSGLGAGLLLGHPDGALVRAAARRSQRPGTWLMPNTLAQVLVSCCMGSAPAPRRAAASSSGPTALTALATRSRVFRTGWLMATILKGWALAPRGASRSGGSTR